MEDTKNIKDDKKEKESPELKEELTEEEVKGVDGGGAAEMKGPLRKLSTVVDVDEININ